MLGQNSATLICVVIQGMLTGWGTLSFEAAAPREAWGSCWKVSMSFLCEAVAKTANVILRQWDDLICVFKYPVAMVAIHHWQCLNQVGVFFFF